MYVCCAMLPLARKGFRRRGVDKVWQLRVLDNTLHRGECHRRRQEANALRDRPQGNLRRPSCLHQSRRFALGKQQCLRKGVGYRQDEPERLPRQASRRTMCQAPHSDSQVQSLGNSQYHRPCPGQHLPRLAAGARHRCLRPHEQDEYRHTVHQEAKGREVRL